MAKALYANNVASLISGSIGPSNTDIDLQPGSGAGWPNPGSDYYYATLVHEATGVIEIVKVTGKSLDKLTVVRAQDFTSAKSFSNGSLIEMRANAQLFRDLDYRTAMGQPDGIPTLDATTRIPVAQMPTSVPIKDAGGKILLAEMPDGVATDTEMNLRALKAGDTFTGTVVINKGAAADSSTNEFGVVNGTSNLFMRARSVADAGNPLINAGDAHIGFHKNAVNTGALVIGPWSSNSYGIRLDSTGACTINGNNAWHAGNLDIALYALKNNTALTGNLTSTGNATFNGLLTVGADIVCYRIAAPTTGAIFLNQAKTKYLFYDGAKYLFNGTDAVHGGNFVATCDMREKENIRVHDVDPYLADSLQLYDFDWKETGRPGCGPMAQDVKDLALQHVHGDERLGIDKGGLALEAVVGLAARIRALEALLNAERIPCPTVN